MTRLCTGPRAGRTGTVERFTPRFWTCDVPATSCATITTLYDGFTVRAHVRKAQDAVAAVWWGSFLADHPALRYDSGADLTGVTLSFDLGCLGDARDLDDPDGPFLEVEVGRDRYVVPLWNYRTDATQTDPADNAFTIPFDALYAGPTLPADDDTVAQDYQRVPVTAVRCVRLVLPTEQSTGTGGGGSDLSPADEATWIISGLSVSGGQMLAIEDRPLPFTRATAGDCFEDMVKFTPEFVADRLRLLGIRTLMLAFGRGRADEDGVLLAPAEAWIGDLAARLAAGGDLPGFLAAIGYPTLSLLVALERWDDITPTGHHQEDFDEVGAVVDGVALLSPTVSAAVDWLAGIAADMAEVIDAAGAPVSVAILAPEWWCGPAGDRRPFVYDPATVSTYGDVPEPYLGAVTTTTGHLDFLWWCSAQAAGVVDTVATEVLAAVPDATMKVVVSAAAFDPAPVVAALTVAQRTATDALGVSIVAAGEGEAWAATAHFASVSIQHVGDAMLWSFSAMLRDGLVFSPSLPSARVGNSGALRRKTIVVP
jgi:hypothetical protein